jgi:hypothetical protein
MRRSELLIWIVLMGFGDGQEVKLFDAFGLDGIALADMNLAKGDSAGESFESRFYEADFQSFC